MTVIVYSTPRCPQCNATKRQLIAWVCPIGRST